MMVVARRRGEGHCGCEAATLHRGRPAGKDQETLRMGAVRRAHWSGAGVKTARWEARCDDALPPFVSG